MRPIWPTLKTGILQAQDIQKAAAHEHSNVSRKSWSLFLGSITISQTQPTHELSIKNYVGEKKIKRKMKPLMSIITCEKQNLRALVRKWEATGYLLQDRKKNTLYNLWIIWTAVIVSASKIPNIFLTKWKKKHLSKSSLSQSWNSSVQKPLLFPRHSENPYSSSREKSLPQMWFWDITRFQSLALMIL